MLSQEELNSPTGISYANQGSVHIIHLICIIYSSLFRFSIIYSDGFANGGCDPGYLQETEVLPSAARIQQSCSSKASKP